MSFRERRGEVTLTFKLLPSLPEDLGIRLNLLWSLALNLGRKDIIRRVATFKRKLDTSTNRQASLPPVVFNRLDKLLEVTLTPIIEPLFRKLFLPSRFFLSQRFRYKPKVRYSYNNRDHSATNHCQLQLG